MYTILKTILKNKSFHLLEECNIDNLEFPFIGKNCFTNQYTIIRCNSQINCEIIGYKTILT